LHNILLKDQAKKQEVVEGLNKYFPLMKDKIIDSIWNKSFYHPKNEEILMNNIEWYLLDVQLYIHEIY